MSMEKRNPENETSIVIFQPDDDHQHQLQFNDHQHELWATQKQIAELFDLDVKSVSHHIQNFKIQRGETANQGILSYQIPTAGGVQMVEHYNHHVIAFVGYNARATKKTIDFQMWVEDLIEQSFRKIETNLSPFQIMRQMIDTLESLDSRVSTLEEHIQPEIEHFTVIAYFRKMGLPSPSMNEAQSIGQRASRLSQSKGYSVGKTSDARYGSVNTYHISILNEVVNRPLLGG